MSTGCRRCHDRHAWRRRDRNQATPSSFIASDELASASAALQIVLLRGRTNSVALANDAVFRATIGWPQRELPAGHPAAASNPAAVGKLLEAIVHLVHRGGRLAAVCEAVRRWVAPPSRTLKELRMLPDAVWHQAKELFLAKLFVERCGAKEPCGATSDDEVASKACWRRLADLDASEAPHRTEFAAAFGLALPRARAWRCPPEENRSRRLLEPLVAASGGRLDALSLEQTLVAARPEQAEVWASPLYPHMDGSNPRAVACCCPLWSICPAAAHSAPFHLISCSCVLLPW